MLGKFYRKAMKRAFMKPGDKSFHDLPCDEFEGAE
jgi:hypothetical protein